MKQQAVRFFGGQFLADLADKLDGGDFGPAAELAYRAVKGRKRLIGYLIYLGGYAAAATGTALGCGGEAVAAGCAYVITASQGMTWLGWGLLQLGILDNSARRKPEGVPKELQAVAGNHLFWGVAVFGTALLAQAFGVPGEVTDTFVNDVLVLTLIQGGLMAPGTAAGIASPSPRLQRGPRP